MNHIIVWRLYIKASQEHIMTGTFHEVFERARVMAAEDPRRLLEMRVISRHVPDGDWETVTKVVRNPMKEVIQ